MPYSEVRYQKQRGAHHSAQERPYQIEDPDPHPQDDQRRQYEGGKQSDRIEHTERFHQQGCRTEDGAQVGCNQRAQRRRDPPWKDLPYWFGEKQDPPQSQVGELETQSADYAGKSRRLDKKTQYKKVEDGRPFSPDHVSRHARPVHEHRPDEGRPRSDQEKIDTDKNEGGKCGAGTAEQRYEEKQHTHCNHAQMHPRQRQQVDGAGPPEEFAEFIRPDIAVSQQQGLEERRGLYPRTSEPVADESRDTPADCRNTCRILQYLHCALAGAVPGISCCRYLIEVHRKRYFVTLEKLGRSAACGSDE